MLVKVLLEKNDDEFLLVVNSSLTMTICSNLAATLYVKLLPAAIRHVRQITVSYPSVDYSVYATAVALRNYLSSFC